MVPARLSYPSSPSFYERHGPNEVRTSHFVKNIVRHTQCPASSSFAPVLTDESVVGPDVYGAVRFVLRLSVTDPLEVGLVLYGASLGPY
jgi:hypothetical protein